MEFGNCSSIMRPLWFDFPLSNQENNEASYLFGNSLLISCDQAQDFDI